MLMKAAMANSNIDQVKLDYLNKANIQRQTLKDARDAAISSSLTTLFDNIGQVGNDLYSNE